METHLKICIDTVAGYLCENTGLNADKQRKRIVNVCFTKILGKGERKLWKMEK